MSIVFLLTCGVGVLGVILLVAVLMSRRGGDDQPELPGFPADL